MASFSNYLTVSHNLFSTVPNDTMMINHFPVNEMRRLGKKEEVRKKEGDGNLLNDARVAHSCAHGRSGQMCVNMAHVTS